MIVGTWSTWRRSRRGRTRRRSRRHLLVRRDPLPDDRWQARWPIARRTAYTDLLARMQPSQLVREIDPTVPEAVDQIVSTCLQPDPRFRYQSTPELLAALEHLDENGVPLPEPTPIWRSWRFWSTAAMLTAALVGGTWWFAQLFAPTVPVVHDPVSVLIADSHEHDGRPTVQGSPRAVARRGCGRGVFRHRLRPAERASRRLTAQCRRRARRKVARVVAQREGVKVVLAGGTYGRDRLPSLGSRHQPADGSSTLIERRASGQQGRRPERNRPTGQQRPQEPGDTKPHGPQPPTRC